MSTSLNSNLETLFTKMENFISTKTVVGEAINFGDVIIVPLVDIVFGVGAGAADGSKEDKNKKETSGGGLGGKITPSAVLVITGGNVQLINVKNQDSVNKLIDMAPGILSKLNLGSFFKKKEDKDDEDADEEKYGIISE